MLYTTTTWHRDLSMATEEKEDLPSSEDAWARDSNDSESIHVENRTLGSAWRASCSRGGNLLYHDAPLSADLADGVVEPPAASHESRIFGNRELVEVF